MKFSIPADFNITTLEKAAEMNHSHTGCSIYEVYGQITQGTLTASGRITDTLPVVSIDDLKPYIDRCHSHNIQFNYTFNASCLGNHEFTCEGVVKIKSFLRALSDCGIDSLTVTLPSVMDLIHDMKLDITIKASAICGISTPSKALFYKNKGIRRMVIDPDITRDFNTLGDICQVFGPGVEIIVNNMCIKNCPYKSFHYAHDAHYGADQAIKNYYFHKCALQRAESIANFLKINWIRPEDLRLYNNVGIEYYKIQGRQNLSAEGLLKSLRRYFSEDYDGNLFDLLTLYKPYNSFFVPVNNKRLEGYVSHFYNNRNFCKNNCNRCTFCDDFAKSHLPYAEQSEMNQKADVFYSMLQDNLWR